MQLEHLVKEEAMMMLMLRHLKIRTSSERGRTLSL
jgi:hypothetical protein